MANSRRDFLKKGSLLAFAAGVPLGLAEKVVSTELASSSKALGLSRTEFEDQLNTAFLIKHGKRQVEVELIAVDDLRPKDKPRGGECFGLRFRGTYDNRLKQETYVIQHRSLGQFSFLLVPIGMNDKSAPYYEAIVNHRLS